MQNTEQRYDFSAGVWLLHERGLFCSRQTCSVGISLQLVVVCMVLGTRGGISGLADLPYGNESNLLLLMLR
jgi:hypothetical protein